MRTDVEIVRNSSEVGGSKALDAWREKAWKKRVKAGQSHKLGFHRSRNLWWLFLLYSLLH